MLDQQKCLSERKLILLLSLAHLYVFKTRRLATFKNLTPCSHWILTAKMKKTIMRSCNNLVLPGWTQISEQNYCSHLSWAGKEFLSFYPSSFVSQFEFFLN